MAWLDELRTIAILMMVVDHALLFFLPHDATADLFRGTVTRCAEPLFVFALTSIVIHLDRPMRIARWLQITGASVATSMLLSMTLEYAVADVLVSIVIAAPVLPLLLRISDRTCVAAIYATSALCVLPIGLGSIAFDYSPILIIHQMLLSRLLFRGIGLGHCALSAGVVLVAGCCGVALGLPLSSSVLVVWFGHPIAVLAIVGIRREAIHPSIFAEKLGSHPLKLYIGHLGAFAFLSWITTNSA